MSFNPKPVSLEEYNQALRAAVNAYYEHAINDPSMSKEEAIRSTAEMSERYLNAVQEFQETQNMQNGANISTTEGIQIDNNTLDADVSSMNTGNVDAGVSVSDDSVNVGGVDNDGGIDDGMDI